MAERSRACRREAHISATHKVKVLQVLRVLQIPAYSATTFADDVMFELFKSTLAELPSSYFRAYCVIQG